MGSPVRSLTASRSGSRRDITRLSDGYLFEAPPELVCPITQAVFSDPVLTQAGHAYERRAIEQYLQTAAVDPLSREPLLNKTLIPVFSLKSRALEYREATARACLDLACAPSPPRPPVTYLRRAVELAGSGDGAFLPQGLTSQVVSYILSHPSNAYDRLALELFARGLAERGYTDRAAAVFFHLLADGEDRTAQAESLRRCVALWQGEASGQGLTALDAALIPSRADGAASTGKGDVSGLIEFEIEAGVFEKLVQMMDRGAPMGWLLDVSAEAGLGPRFAARLCEEILFPRGAPAAGAPGTDGGSGGPPPLPWATEKEVLVKYTYVLTTALRDEQERAERRIQALEGTGRRRWQRGWGEEGEGEDGGKGHEFLRTVQRVLRHPLVMLPCAAVAAAGDPRNPAVRAAIAVPFLALMRPLPAGDEIDANVNGKVPPNYFDE